MSRILMEKNMNKKEKIFELVNALKLRQESQSEFSKFSDISKDKKALYITLYNDFAKDLGEFIVNLNHIKDNSYNIALDELNKMVHHYESLAEFSDKSDLNEEDKNVYYGLYFSYSKDLTVLKNSIEKTLE